MMTMTQTQITRLMLPDRGPSALHFGKNMYGGDNTLAHFEKEGYICAQDIEFYAIC